MRFLFVSNIYPPHVHGGYELGCQAAAHAMARLGHEVRVATSASLGTLRRSKHDNSVAVEELFEPVYGYEQPLNAMLLGRREWQVRREHGFAGMIPGNAAALARFCRQYRPDVIWIFNPLGIGPLGILEAALTTHARCIVHFMDDIDFEVGRHAGPVWMLARFARLKRRFAAISCSFKTLASNEAIGSWRSHRMIWNGIDFDAVAPRGQRTRDASALRLAYFGQVEPRKGVLQSLRAVARARQMSPHPVTLDIYGAGSAHFAGELRSEIAALGLGEAVTLHGFLERARLLRRLTEYDGAIMLLNDDEPFGYAPVEAAACGLPVIVTAGPGCMECFPEEYPLTVRQREDTDEAASRILLLADAQRHGHELCAGLREHLRARCDFNTVTLPAYLRTIAACQAADGRYDLDAAMAAWYTCEHYTLTQSV